MKQNLDEIAELAESIGKRYFSKGKVAVKKIAKTKEIDLVYGMYKNYYDGLLCFDRGRFYMHLNLEKIASKNSERLRFTISHELGHYFIDSHRKKLQQGISLSFKGEMTIQEKTIEREANHFASHLLMPKTKFCNFAQNFEIGLESILELKKYFDVSLYATAKQYIHLNISCSILIKWNPDYSFHYAQYSDSFGSMAGIKYKPQISFSPNYITSIVKAIDNDSLNYFETATLLSRWIATIAPGSTKDIVGLEQTVKLGEFGGLTLLTFK